MSETASAAPTAAAAPTTTAPTAPTQGQATAPPAVDPAELAKKLDLKTKESIVVRRQLEAQLKAKQERITKLEALEKRLEMAKLNPEEHLRSLYGEKWYDAITEARINGVPPAAVIASEMAKLEDKLRTEFSSKETERAQAQQQAQQQRAVAQERQQRGLAAEFVASTAAEYPALMARFDSHESAAHAVYEHAKATFLSTSRFDEGNNIIQQGRVLTWKEAADELESRELERATKLATLEKYREKFAPVLTPAQKGNTIGGPKLQQQSSPQSQQTAARRSLTNDIHGSTTAERPAETPDERRERAIKRYNEVRARRPTE